MFLAGILVLASLFVPLWGMTITGDLVWEEQELGEMTLKLNADYYDVSVNMTIDVDDESVSEGINIPYANLNYTEDAGDWLFGDANETLPADTWTQYIYPIMLIMSIFTGIIMLVLAFVTPKSQKWIIWLMLIIAIISVIYFWYSWDLYLSHLDMNFFSETGALLDLPTGVTVSGNPGWGFYLIIAGTILAIVSAIRTRVELFAKPVE